VGAELVGAELVGTAEFLHVDGETHIHDESNSSFFAILRTRLKATQQEVENGKTKSSHKTISQESVNRSLLLKLREVANDIC